MRTIRPLRDTSGVTLCSLASFVATGLATPIAGPFVYPASGHSYFLLDRNSWTASEGEAISLGGHLATINDLAENTWVFTTFAPLAKEHRPSPEFHPALWVGLNDAAMEGTFTWASGEPVSFTHWDTGQPNSAGGDEDYVLMRGVSPTPPSQPGFWNDFVNHYVGDDIFGVVEVVPEPGSICLLAVSTLVILASRRRK